MNEYSAAQLTNMSGSKRVKDTFYDIIVNYTHFENEELVLDYQYFKNNVVDSINWAGILHCCGFNTPNAIPAVEGVARYNRQNNLVFSPAKQRMITLIMELFIADGGNTTIMQINNKVMNLRTKNTLPFTYLYKTGVIEKTLSKKPRAAVGADGIISSNTNLKKKNQNIIKALTRFYKSHKDARLNKDSKALADFDFSSEPEKWISAMLKKHGQKMVDFLNVCVANIVENFMQELEARGMWNELQSIRSYEQATATEVALRMMTQIVSSKAGSMENISNFAQAYYTVEEKHSGRYQDKWIKTQSQKIKQAIRPNEASGAVRNVNSLLDELLTSSTAQQQPAPSPLRSAMAGSQQPLADVFEDILSPNPRPMAATRLPHPYYYPAPMPSMGPAAHHAPRYAHPYQQFDYARQPNRSQDFAYDRRFDPRGRQDPADAVPRASYRPDFY